MKIFAMAASARKDSLNKKFIEQAVRVLKESTFASQRNSGDSANVTQSEPTNGRVTIDQADFAEFDMPVYNGDLERSSGVPETAKKLSSRIASADAIVISTPEYNGGIPGPLKNAIDWISRIKPVSLSGKPLLLMGASPGALGAIRSLWHTRVPFEALGTLVYPEMFGLPHANEAFTADGQLADVKNRERLERLLTAFASYAENVKGLSSK